MIDTTDPEAIELALTYCQGKSIINSINLEDGEEKFERVCPLARTLGAALVVGSIDEDKAAGAGVHARAQARHRRTLLPAAHRKVRHPARKTSSSIRWCFPAPPATPTTSAAAVETIEGIRLVKEKLPYVKTVLGISNVSFGLPAAAREVVNSVFLYYCTKAGLDLAIVNAEKLERFASIPERGAAAGREPAVQLAAEIFGDRRRDRRVSAHRARGLAAANREQRPPSTSGTSPPSPSISASRQARKATRRGPAARPAPGQLHHRGHQGRPGRRSRPQASPKAPRRWTSSTGR